MAGGYMEPTEKIKRLLKKLNFEADAQVHQRILDDVLAAQAKTKILNPAASTAGIWRTIMKSKITKFAVAAVVIVTIGLLAYYHTGSVDGTSSAYATVLENIRKAHSVAYKQRIISGKSDSTSSNIINSAGIMRDELKFGQVLIFDPHNDIQLTLSTVDKKAFVHKRIGGKKTDFNWLTWITEQFSQQGEYKGRKMFQGRFADLYEIDQPFEKRSVWVDPETQLPIYSEERQMRDSGKVSPEVYLSITDFGGTGNLTRTMSCGGGGLSEYTVIMSDFQWNIDVNDSLFSSTPPPDYNVTETISKVTEPNGTDIVEVLKFCIEVNGLQFPKNLDVLGDPNVNRPMLIKKFRKDGEPEKELNTAIEFADILVRAVVFVQNRKSESNWFYNEGVMLGEADKPVCWWKLENAQGYRVIYGDLSIRDANDAPN
jgi:hypothetical protein